MDLFDLAVANKLAGGGGGGGDIDVDALNVTENGVYSASSGHAFDPVTVSVPQGVFPSGTSQIMSNGIYDVSNFASASVNVPQPTGTSVITSNGLYNVTDFSQASVSVPTGITPSGTSSITANGIYDITNFASVDVNVSGGGGGDHDAEDAIIDRSISGAYENSRVTRIGSYAFASCTALTSVNLPNVTKVYASAFRGCSGLTTAVFGEVNEFQSGVFIQCSSLMSLYILATSVAVLSNINVFNSTPMSNSSYTGSYGSIYVPASLVNSYKTANNWGTFANRITSYTE